MLNVRSRRKAIHRKTRLLLYLEMKDAIEKVLADGAASFSRASSGCEYWRRPAVNAGTDVPRHQKGLLAECSDTNVVSKNTGSSQEDIDLRWNNMGNGCLRAFFFEGNCNDEMGNQNGMPTDVAYIPAGFGQAAESNGNTSSIDCGNGSDVNSLTTFSMAFLMSPYSDGENHVGRICEKFYGLYVRVREESSGYVKLEAYVRYTATHAYSKSNGMFPLNQASDVVVAYDEGGDRKIHFYLNGAEVTYESQTVSVGDRVDDSSYNVYLLNSNDGAGAFEGWVDRFLLWNRVLSSAEIKRLSRKGIVSSWRFDDNCRDDVGVNGGGAQSATYVNGSPGRAISLMSSDSVVYVGDHPSTTDMRRIGIRAKIYIPSQPSETYGVIIRRYEDVNNGWVLDVNFDTQGVKIRGRFGAATSGAYSLASTNLPYGEWHEVAYSYDDYGDRKVHLWVDGVEVTYANQDAASGDAGSDEDYPLVIGNNAIPTVFDGNRPISGYISHIVLYRRPLTTSDLSGAEITCSSLPYRPILAEVANSGWDSRGQRDPILLMNETGEVIRDGGQYVLYYSGYPSNGISTKYWKIGRATSVDGIHWSPDPPDAPVLDKGEGGDWDELDVRMGSVIKMNDGTYRMYFTGTNDSLDQGLGLATSTDGINFTKHPGNPLIMGDEWNSNNGRLLLPFTIKLSTGQWVMTFEANSPYKCYMGVSDDGISWTAANNGDAILSPGAGGTWDDGGVANPKVFELAPNKYLLGYNGEPGDASFKLGFAYSTDLINWTRFAGNPVMVPAPAEWDGYRIENAFIAKNDVGTPSVRMWYFGMAGNNPYAKIGYATCPQESMDIFDLIDVTSWKKHVEPELYGGHSIQLLETGGSAKQFYEVKTLTVDSYVVSFLAYTDGSEVTSADVVPFADTAFSNEINEFHYEHLGGPVYLGWGVFTATAADWNIGVEVKGNKAVSISLLTCMKAGASLASGPYPRSLIANDTTTGEVRQADSLTVGGNANFRPQKGTLDVEFYPLFPSDLSNSFEFYFAHFYGADGQIKLYKNDVDKIEFRIQANGDDDSVVGTISWNRGDRIRIRVVWHCQEKLDGTNHMLMYARVNDGAWSQIGASSAQPTAPSPEQTLYVGRAGTSAGYEANSFVSWLRIYHRPLLHPWW